MLPPLLLLICVASCQEILWMLSLVVTGLWFRLPACFFHDLFRFSDSGIVSPHDWKGWLATMIVYSIFAVIMWLFFGIVKKKK